MVYVLRKLWTGTRKATGRVGHNDLFRSVRSILFRSIFEFLATYETQKNAMNAMFFC